MSFNKKILFVITEYRERIIMRKIHVFTYKYSTIYVRVFFRLNLNVMLRITLNVRHKMGRMLEYAIHLSIY